MKKFWTILTVALVALGAVACSNNFEDEVVAPVEGISFTAAIDQTRTALEKDGDIYKTVWVGDETIVVSAEGASFEFKNSTAATSTFTCAEAGAAELLGEAVTLTYNKVIDSAKGAAGLTLAGESDAFAAESNITLTVGNAFLKFTSEADVTFTASKAIFGNGEALATTATVEAGEDVLVAVMAADACTLSFAINGVTCNSTTLNIVNNKIYNLGTLEAPVKNVTVYLAPQMWLAANAKFSVEYGDSKVEMTPTDGKINIYEAEVPENVAAIKFNRMNPDGTQVWNSSASLSLPTDDKVYYYMTGWDAGEWRVYTQTVWAVAGEFNEWGNGNMTRIENSTVSYLNNVTLTAYKNFKIKDSSTWDVSYGAGSINYVNPNKSVVVSFSGGNISVTEDGTYDIYFDESDLKMYVVSTGADYTTATEQTENGNAPKMDKDKIYFNATGHWDNDGAIFRAWVWGGSVTDKWIYPKKNETNGMYEFAYDGYTDMIILRSEPGKDQWTGEWGRVQTTVPVGDENCFTMTSYSTGSWSVYGN